MKATDRHEMFMDAIAWILHWGTSHGEFDESLKWTSSFLKYLCGFTTQAEEDWFDDRCNAFHVDMTSSSRKSYYMSCSKKLSDIQCVETLQRQNIVHYQWSYEHFHIV